MKFNPINSIALDICLLLSSKYCLHLQTLQIIIEISSDCVTCKAGYTTLQTVINK